MTLPFDTVRLPPSSLDDEQRDLYETITGGPRGGSDAAFAVTDAEGRLRGPFAAMLLAPALGDPVQALGSAIRFASSIDDRTREIAILTVARVLASTFERDAHEAVARRLGMTDDELEAIRRGDLASLTARERSAATLVAALVTGDGETEDAGQANFTSRELYELTVLAGYYRMLATQLRFFRLDDPA